MDLENLYKTQLQKVKLMQLATSSENQPWLCNVWFVADENDIIYWMSRETRRHSIEIAKNPKISCTFHKSFDEGLGQKGQALVISGQAEQISAKNTQQVYELYATRYPKLKDMQSLAHTVDGTGVHKFYRCAPHEIMWWDEVNFPDEPRQQVK